MICEMCERYCTTRLKPRIHINFAHHKKVFYFCSEKCKREWTDRIDAPNGHALLWTMKHEGDKYRFVPIRVAYATNSTVTFFSRDLTAK